MSNKITTSITLLLFVLPLTATSQSISFKKIPASPDTLKHGERVRIQLDYQESSSQWVSIRPFTNGKPTPNAKTTAPAKMEGTGFTRAYFTIRGMQDVHVDSIEVRYLYSDMLKEKFKMYLPVSYFFTDSISD